MRTNSLKIYVAIAFLFVLFGIGLFYTRVRWINADEGAHLSDVQLVSEGFIPFVDFQSREPLYIGVLFLGRKIVGNSIFHMRMIPFTFFIFNGLLLFYLAKIVFNVNIALLSGLVYYLLPFSFVFSSLIKTEQFGIFFTLLAFISFFKFIRVSRPIWAFCSGLFSLFAYYSRMADVATFASLIILFLVVFFVKKNSKKGFVVFLLSYVAGVLLVLGSFWSALPLRKIVFSNLNPFFLFMKPILKTFPPNKLNQLGVENLPQVKQNFSRTMIEFTRTVDMNLFLLIIFAFIFILILYKLLKNKSLDINLLILIVWSGTYIVFYGYYLFQRGIFTQYFTEIMPPLFILFSFMLFKLYSMLKSFVNKIFFLFLPFLFFSLFFLFRYGSLPYPNRFLYLLLGFCFLLAGILFFNRVEKEKKLFVYIGMSLLFAAGLLFFGVQQTDYLRWLPKKIVLLVSFGILIYGTYIILRAIDSYSLSKFVSFVAFSIIFSSIAISGATSGIFLSFSKYECTWSPSTVRNVVNLLRRDKTNFSVLSGAMIWSYEAEKRPFMNITHPLRFNAGFPENLKTRIRSYFKANPPKYIIEDGYLKANFLRYMPIIYFFKSENYIKIADIDNVQVLLNGID